MPHVESPSPAATEGRYVVSPPVSRREFLKTAALAGASIGAAGGLGALLGACGGGTTTTTSATTGSPPTTAGTGSEVPSTTSSSEASTTATSASAEAGDEFKAGYVLPLSGAMADIGAALTWQLDWFAENVWKDGLLMGDGKKHKVTVVTKDSQSDLDRASQVAQDLIVNGKVVLIGASSGADTVVPVREVAEDFGCPCVTFDCPGDAWNDNQPEGGFKWSWHTGFVLRDLAMNFLKVWDALSTNKVVGGLFPNDSDGTTFADALSVVFQAKGYTYVDPGRFEDGADDFAALIQQLRRQGAEIVSGVPLPADYAKFWVQAGQQGFRPKAATMARALLLPAGVDALGDSGDGQTMECWFHPAFPYTGAVSKLTAKQVCDLWEQDKGAQWVQPLCMIGQFEVWTDIMTRCSDPTSKDQTVAAVKQTKIITVGGPVDWTVNPDPYSGFYNFSTKPIAAGQWVKGAGKWKYDMQIVASVTQTDIATTAAVKPLA